MSMARKVSTYSQGAVTIYPPTDTKRSWRIRWRTGGRQHECTFKTQELADQEARRVALDLDLGRENVAVSVNLTVREAVLAYVESLPPGRYRERQENSLRRWVIPAIGSVKLLRWTPADSEAIIRKMETQGLKPSYVRNIGAAMRATVTYCRKKRWLRAGDEDPMFGVKYTPRSQLQGESVHYIPKDALPTHGDLEALFEAARSLDEPAWALAWELSSWSGLRWGELVALQKKDVDLEKRLVLVHQTVEETCGGKIRVKPSTKNGKVRHSIYPPSLSGRLSVHLDSLEPDDRLFPAPKGGLARRGRHRDLWIRVATEAKWPTIENRKGENVLPAWTPHDLRHAAACWMLFDLRAEPAQVAYWLGHHDASFTIAQYVGIRGDIIAAGHKLTEGW